MTATYVLVHGGGHGGWCYAKVAPSLRAAGHDVHTPTLTGLGERAHLVGPDVTLDLHIRDVVHVLHFEDLHDVILVGHSYGGMVITGVADRAADRIGKLVYLDAANPVNGQSLVDVAGPVTWHCFEEPLQLTNEDALWAIPQYHIVCRDTVPTRDPELIGKARAEGRLWEIDTGHDLMITEPEQTAKALLEVAR